MGTILKGCSVEKNISNYHLGRILRDCHLEEDLRGSMLRRIVGAAMLEYIEGLDVEKNLRSCYVGGI